MEMKADIEGDRGRQYTQFSKIYIQRHVNVRFVEGFSRDILLYAVIFDDIKPSQELVIKS